jgi:thymidylate synthase ThyX
MTELGLHKQLANRILEPFTHISVVLTGTNTAYENFYALRRHPDAEPHIRALADAMYAAHTASTPVVRGHHFPFLTDEEKRDLGVFVAPLVSAARCARVSYLKHDGTVSTLQEDKDLAKRLSDSGHFSPFEHQGEATPALSQRSGNFVGWLQYRKMLPNEFIAG